MNDRDRLQVRDINVIIILKFTVKEYAERLLILSSCLRTGRAGFCERGYELSSYVKRGIFLLSEYCLLKKDSAI